MPFGTADRTHLTLSFGGEGAPIPTMVVASACDQVYNYFHPHSPLYFDPESDKPIQHRFRDQVNWADHGFVNLAWSNVIVLHEVSRLVVQGNLIFPADHPYILKMIQRALEVAEGWQQKTIAFLKRQHRCDHWGDATGFNRFKPCEFSSRFVV